MAEAGDVMVWGSNQESQLGVEDESFVSSPMTNPYLRNIQAILRSQLDSCIIGFGHPPHAPLPIIELEPSLVDGQVYACGALLKTIPIPQVVLPSQRQVNQVACGTQYIAAWRGTVACVDCSVWMSPYLMCHQGR